MKNNEKKPINIYGIIAIVLAAALLIGVIVWQFGGNDQSTPSDPTGSSGTQPSGGGEGSDPTNPNSDPTNPSGGTEPSGEPSDPSQGTDPGPDVTEPSDGPTNPPAPTDPPLPTGPIGEPPTQPTEPKPTEPPTQPTEPKPTEPKPTEPPTQPTEPKPTEPKPTEPPTQPTEPKPTEPPTQPTEPKPTEPPTQPTEPKPTDPPPTEPQPTEPEITWEKVNETVYAESDVNIRSGPGSSFEKLGQLKKGEAVKRIAIGSNGWSRIEYNGKEAYVSSGYLTTQKPTEDPAPSEPTDNTNYKTMYTNRDTGYTVMPMQGLPYVEAVKKGVAIAVVPGGEQGEFSKIMVGGQFYWMLTAHLSENKDDEPAKDPDNPWNNYVQDADPETGISWDGKSPIVYTYKDGTTGTEPKDGAKYEESPGYIVIYTVPKDSAGRPAGGTCSSCGKVIADGWGDGEEYCHQNAVSHFCYACGKWVNAYTCHDCVDWEIGQDTYCDSCGKVSGNGTNGTCKHKLVGGSFTCEHCGVVYQGYTCHTCKED